MKTYYVYIVECRDSKYYTGITNDVDRRVAQHNLGEDEGSYTYTRRPVRLVFAGGFGDVVDAITFEKRLKGWSRKKKLALIEGRWDELPELSRPFYEVRRPSTAGCALGARPCSG